MAQQIGDGVVSVFPDHGQTGIGGPNRYSIGEKGGEWEEAEVVSAQDADADADQLVATARLMDPDTLSDIPVRKYVGTIKELAERDMAVPSSIGWGQNDAMPGGVDLMEASIVGIPADPRTHSDASAAEVVARSAVDAGADPDALVDAVQSAVESEQSAHNLDDPEFSEGDAVEWSSNDTTVRGRVADIGAEFSPAEGVTITGDEGEAVYLIHELDDSLEPPQYRRENVAKPESSLNESQADLPPLEGNFVSDNDSTPTDGGTTDDEQNASDGETRAPEDVSEDDLLTFTARHFDGIDEGDFAEAVDAADASYIGECDPEALANLVSEATGAEYDAAQAALEDLMESNAMDDDEEDDEEENEGDHGDDDDEDEDDEQSSDDPDSEQSASDDELAELREKLEAQEQALEELREGGITESDVDTPEPDDEQDADEPDTRNTDEPATKQVL